MMKLILITLVAFVLVFHTRSAAAEGIMDLIQKGLKELTGGAQMGAGDIATALKNVNKGDYELFKGIGELVQGILGGAGDVVGGALDV
ncbi:hypothetical protein HNY73_001637 [Argiope bruennichi]|uniref:Uncharacterized protein n=1 Tax=Argiope bruennichi TaxID=94029 RepID=A0A8T0FV99_ARGBR|nr:hypothetical protein HNY73_001637 [Argiope bruennichi]